MGPISAKAETFTFHDLNFECTTPEGWNSQHKIGDVVHAFNPSRTKFFCLKVYKFDVDRKQLDEIEHGMVVTLEGQGYTGSYRAPLLLRGVSFDTYAFTLPTGGGQTYHLHEYVGRSGDFTYQFELAMYDGTPSADPELKAILDSFKLLTKNEKSNTAVSSPAASGKVD